MHILMPWFLPLGAFMAWLGARSARQIKSEGGSGRSKAMWLITLMTIPLLCWFLAQFLSD
jgi:hypothetical protein